MKNKIFNVFLYEMLFVHLFRSIIYNFEKISHCFANLINLFIMRKVKINIYEFQGSRHLLSAV